MNKKTTKKLQTKTNINKKNKHVLNNIDWWRPEDKLKYPELVKNGGRRPKHLRQEGGIYDAPPKATNNN